MFCLVLPVFREEKVSLDSEAWAGGAETGEGVTETKAETYEEASKRTGRKWPYRTEAWPCPACGKAECDLDVTGDGRYRHGGWVFFYQHVTLAQERES